MLRAARPTAALGLSLWRAAMCSRAAGNSSDAAGDRQLAAAPGSPAAASERAAAPPAAPKPKRLRTLPGAPASGMQPAGRGGSGSSRPDYKEPGPGLTQLPGGGVLQLQTDLLAPAVAAALFEQLRRELPWEQRNVRVMGRQVAQPRLIAYQADGPELQASALLPSRASCTPECSWSDGGSSLQACYRRVPPALPAGPPGPTSFLVRHPTIIPPSSEAVHVQRRHAGSRGLAPRSAGAEAAGGGVCRH